MFSLPLLDHCATASKVGKWPACDLLTSRRAASNLACKALISGLFCSALEVHASKLAGCGPSNFKDDTLSFATAGTG